MSAGVAEEVCSALQVPELEVGQLVVVTGSWRDKLGQIELYLIFFGGMMGVYRFKPPRNY